MHLCSRDALTDAVAMADRDGRVLKLHVQSADVQDLVGPAAAARLTPELAVRAAGLRGCRRSWSTPGGGQFDLGRTGAHGRGGRMGSPCTRAARWWSDSCAWINRNRPRRLANHVEGKVAWAELCRDAASAILLLRRLAG